MIKFFNCCEYSFIGIKQLFYFIINFFNWWLHPIKMGCNFFFRIKLTNNISYQKKVVTLQCN